jgi:NAD-dependent SIR2 family protein deacetylase
VTTPQAVARAAEAIARADGLLVTAGAGMGVDSGLPDFRGDQGFWRAYPAYAELGLSFVDLANPRWFDADPALAWGFYGHRLNLYRATTPHAGFARLRAWADARPNGGYVLTSNVDGQFQRAGFPPERIVECHGSIGVWQCRAGCDLFDAPPAEIAVAPETFRASPPLPACPRCGGPARPNVLMFGDGEWDDTRTMVQQRGLERWLVDRGTSRDRLTIIECGAGTAVPTIRATGEALSRRMAATLIRINPREPEGPPGTISIALGAAEALQRLDAALSAQGAS